MTVYTGRTFQTCALRVWGVWVSMRDFHAATARTNSKSNCRSLNTSTSSAQSATKTQSEIRVSFRSNLAAGGWTCG
jgi:hypothetical protein